MVKLITKENVHKFAKAAYLIYRFQELFTRIVEVNNPNLSPCVYATWHAHQGCVHGIEDKNNLNILISRSKDGDIVAYICEHWGFKVIRGSAGKSGGTSSMMQMITELKENRCCAIMVDGPNGPAKIVKEGVIKTAKLGGAPIVPVIWYSEDKTLLKFKSWDQLRMPFLFCRIMNLYGEPIYINPDNTPEQDEECLLKVQNALLELENKAPAMYKELKKKRAWKIFKLKQPPCNLNQ